MTGAGLLTSPRLREAPSEAAGCRDLRGQVARLERERTELACSTWPRTGLTAANAAGGAARLLSLGELESLRAALVDSLARTRRELGERLAAEERNRRLIEAMLADPAAHPWVRVSHADIGEPGCRHWHVRPRFGLLGMLAGWWRVVVSSGCPLQPEGCFALDWRY